MKASETSLLNLFSSIKQFTIPIYQRRYDWSKQECKELFDTILKAGKDNEGKECFIGSIVYVKDGVYQATAFNNVLIIDGQQRLTTITLLLKAITNYMEENNIKKIANEMTSNEIINEYLINEHKEGERNYKLVLTKSDKESLFSVIKSREYPQDYSENIKENYDFFSDLLKENDINEIFNGILKLSIIDVSLDPRYDKAQQIFESLNSTGKALDQSDLIRNYMLMGLDKTKQDEIYTNYWYPMEEAFSKSEYDSIFDSFLRDYLTIKTNIIPKFGDIYEAFKKYSYGRDTKELISNVNKYSKHYINLHLETEEISELRQAIINLNELDVAVAYPFLLVVYEDYSNQKINKNEFLEILTLVENYVFRRSICGIPTNSLNKTFATLHKKINPDSYVESVKVNILLLEKYRNFPNDEEFKEQLMVKDIYNYKKTKYLLRKIENYHRKKELIDPGNYTIEHIMPQKADLTPEWRKELGDNWKLLHEKYIHTLGNLTLTEYNSELSCKSFKYKKGIEGGFDHSPLFLNNYLAKLGSWSEKEINERAELLAAISVNLWERPKLPKEILEKYLPETSHEKINYNLEVYGTLEENMPMRGIYDALKESILDINDDVREEFKKLYIAYKTKTNFVDVIPWKNKLVLTLNIPFNKINDPDGKCKDITGTGRWGNGDTRISLYSIEDIPYAIEMVNQSYNYIKNNNKR
jgi:uncharacterized protein with ParB-like and HNH nuclease domain/predicted transport protein